VPYFAGARLLLRPGGRVAILESRLEGVAARWINQHGTVPLRVQAEMTQAGYELLETHDLVHGHWFALFGPDLVAHPPSTLRRLATVRR